MATKYKRATAAVQRGDHEAAVPLLRDTMRLLPMLANDQATWQGLQQQLGASYDHVARARWQGGRIEEAVALQRQAVGLVRGSALVYHNLGAYLLQRHGDNATDASPATAGGELLREAEVAFEKALSIEPKNEEVNLLLLQARYNAVTEGNIQPLEALHRKLVRVLRDPTLNRAALCPTSYVANDAVDEELHSVASAAAAERIEGGIDVLGSWIHDSVQLGAARRSLRNNRPHTIRGGFSDEFARIVHATLSTKENDAHWECNAAENGTRVISTVGPGYGPGANAPFWVRRCVSKSGDMEHSFTPLLSTPIRRLVSALSGEDASGDTLAQATLYRNGDFLSLHNDAGIERRVAFTWHLDLRWQPGDGGELAVVCPEDNGEMLIAPEFNTLTLFRVHTPAATSEHAVLPVVGNSDADGGGRFAVSGWFTSAVD